MCIINNSRKFVYVHIPKTAGTSVTAYFAHFSRYNDVEIGGTPLGESHGVEYLKRYGVSKHSTLSQIVDAVVPQDLSGHFVFTFVREPLNRLHSGFHFLRRWSRWSGHEQFLTFQGFEEFVDSDIWLEPGYERFFEPQVSWVGDMAVGRPFDYVGKLETIEHDIDAICSALNIDVADRPSSLDRRNYNPDSSPALLPQRLLSKVLKRYQADYEQLGYEEPAPLRTRSSGRFVAQISDEEAREKVESRKWFHSFELRPGLITPGRPESGRTDPRKSLTEVYGVPEDLRGATALDIGTLDGPYAFELERRGASVTALDIQSPDVTGFNTAKQILGSRVTYIQGNVYELTRLLAGREFDFITYFGVWYHLKHPVRAFEQIHTVLKSDGLLLLEGAFLVHYAEAPGREPEDLKEEAVALAKSDLPICLFYGNGYRGDRYSWVVPNLACLKQWLNAAALELEPEHRTWAPWPRQRFQGRARKIPNRPVPIDNPIW